MRCPSINQSINQSHIYLLGSHTHRPSQSDCQNTHWEKHKAKYTTDLQLERKHSGGASLVACEGHQQEQQYSLSLLVFTHTTFDPQRACCCLLRSYAAGCRSRVFFLKKVPDKRDAFSTLRWQFRLCLLFTCRASKRHFLNDMNQVKVFCFIYFFLIFHSVQSHPTHNYTAFPFKDKTENWGLPVSRNFLLSAI